MTEVNDGSKCTVCRDINSAVRTLDQAKVAYSDTLTINGDKGTESVTDRIKREARRELVFAEGQVVIQTRKIGKCVLDGACEAVQNLQARLDTLDFADRDNPVYTGLFPDDI